MLHQLRVGGGLLDDRGARREVAAQHRDAALRIDRIRARADHVLREAFTGALHLLAERAAGDGHRIEVQHRLQLAQQRGNAAGAVEVFHVVLA